MSTRTRHQLNLTEAVRFAYCVLCVADSIPARNKYLYELKIFVSGLSIAYVHFMFVNTPTTKIIKSAFDTKYNTDFKHHK